MKRQITFSARLFQGTTARWRLPAALPCWRCSRAAAGLAADEFEELVGQIPRSANAVVLLNMEKAKASPLGVKEHWKGNVEKAFEDGLVRVPPQATLLCNGLPDRL